MTKFEQIFEDHSLKEGSYFRAATLAQFRWVAILGQSVALSAAYFVFDIDFNWALCMSIVSLWAVLNVLQQTLFSRTLRLDEPSAFIALFVDLLEITLMLGLTGGLNNPFAAFIVVPAILAATTLQSQSAGFLMISSLGALVVLAFYATPISYQGERITLPQVLLIAHFLSLTILLVFMSLLARRVSSDNLRLTQALAASELALQREHRLSSLGALVAAYAHELGTPLATIRLTAQDLLDDKLSKSARADIELIAAEAKRSANILQSMGARGKSDKYVQTLPLAALIEEAAAPHLNQDIAFALNLSDGGALIVNRSEAIIQGLRNIIQNASDFARSRVEVTLMTKPETIFVRVEDDGPGFPADILGRIGDPYLHSHQTPDRRSYKGLGLGLFISKTLLERAGAKVDFANRPNPQSGAVAVVSWKRATLEIDPSQARAALGDNQETI